MGSSSEWDEIMVKQWASVVVETERAAADLFPFPQNYNPTIIQQSFFSTDPPPPPPPPLFFSFKPPSSDLQINFPTPTGHLISSLHRSSPPNPTCDVGGGRLAIIGNDVEDRKPPPLRTVTMKRIKGRKKVRDPRFSFKTMSDVDVLDDGYKWRKYGQKVVKNTLHPRSYYRCTQDNCRVKKRVERLAEDPRMVITTYEGRHAHSPSLDNLEETTGQRSASHLNNFFW